MLDQLEADTENKIILRMAAFLAIFHLISRKSCHPQLS